ncbi:MAG TPA: chloride channel protein [Acidimicrobiales bacterium]|nr:chloride channel protein [Acidimicrobiales bacterium]
MSRRFPRLLAAAVVTGVITGLVVAGFEWVAHEVLLDEVLELPLWQLALAPGIGLALTVALLRWAAFDATPSTSDEYVKAYHHRQPRLPLRQLPGKLAAGVATIGSGGAVGLEGPSIYAGSALGLAVHARLERWLGREDARLLLSAGAAAGVAAIFQTPATGVIFALEAPYRDDVARRALLPALLASAASYLTFVAVLQPESVFPALGVRPGTIELSDLLGATVLGVLAGLGGRGFAWLVRAAKSVARSTPWWVRVLGGGVVLGALAVASDAAFDESLTIGPGYQAVEWITDPEHGIGLIALLFAMRMVATITTVGAGGAGGLFIPLAVQGVLLGRLVGEILPGDEGSSSLWPTLGLAAFLGAGYRAPIAAVMFVAESTSGDAYVVPALVAAAVSQIVAGRSSVSEGQRTARLGHLERRFTLPITSALTTDVLTVPPDATVSELVHVHVIGRRERSIPVVDGGRYLGMCGLDEIDGVERRDWEATTVDGVLATDHPVGRPSWTLRDAVAAMERSGIDVLPVTDSEGTFIGVVQSTEIVKLDEILDETGG